MNSCVFCGGTDNLNTSFTITVEDGQKIAVSICDEHAETATVKSARDAYIARQQEINEVLAKAKALGLNLTTQPNGLIVAQGAPAPQPVPAAQPVGQPVAQPGNRPQALLNENDPNVIPTTIYDSKSRSVVTGGIDTPLGAASGHVSHDLSKTRGVLPHDALQGKVQLTVVEGRGGQPLAIPAKRQDGLGTTRVRVAKSDDQDLQRRFKHMASDTMDPERPRVPNFARRGYEVAGTRQCPLCAGECEVQSGGQSIPCPKCGGAGEISVY